MMKKKKMSLYLKLKLQMNSRTFKKQEANSY